MLQKAALLTLVIFVFSNVCVAEKKKPEKPKAAKASAEEKKTPEQIINSQLSILKWRIAHVKENAARLAAFNKNLGRTTLHSNIGHTAGIPLMQAEVRLLEAVIKSEDLESLRAAAQLALTREYALVKKIKARAVLTLKKADFRTSVKEVEQGVIKFANARLASILKRSAKLRAEKRWGFLKYSSSLWDGKNLIRKFEQIKNPLLEKYLKNYQAYRVIVYNPVSAIAGRKLKPYSLITQKEKTWHIDNDKKALEFISSLKLKIDTQKEARDVLNLFALLRDYKIEEKQRTYKYNYIKSKPEDWKTVITKNKNTWSLACVFLTDPVITSCVRYKITISEKGKVTITSGKVIFRVGGYK